MSTNMVTILQNVKSTLAGINGAGNFKTTVRRAEYWAQAVIQIDPIHCPWIGIRPVSDIGPHQPMGKLQRDLNLKLHCIVTASTVEAAIVLLMNLGDDIFEALNVDTHRGTTGSLQNATGTYVGDMIFEEYTPDNNVASGMVDVRVRYHRTTRAS